MSVNSGITNQAYTLMNEPQGMAKGETAIAVADTASFVSAGQKMINLGYDEVFGAISKLITKTISFARLYLSNQTKRMNINSNFIQNSLTSVSKRSIIVVYINNF